MFERFFCEPRCLRRYREGPMKAEREEFLRYNVAEGRSDLTLRQVMRDILIAAELLTQKDTERVICADLQWLEEQWINALPNRRSDARTLRKRRTTFLGHARIWLRFIGRFKEKAPLQPFGEELERFIEFGRRERGLASETCKYQRRVAREINITGNPNVPASTYAKVIVDTAVSLTGGRGQNPFFPTKAQIAIQTGFEVLRHMEAYVTIPNIHRLLLNETDANAAIETLMNKGGQRSHELVVALRDGFFGQPPEQLGGVQGTLSTYLVFFINPEIAEVFCANEPTFSMDQIDDGKIVCIAMPQKFQSERLYINTILKLSYYFHALSRFDKPTEEREKANVIVLFADEGQEIITGAESAFADHRAAGIIREARATRLKPTHPFTARSTDATRTCSCSI
jgi:hypothetical protein